MCSCSYVYLTSTCALGGLKTCPSQIVFYSLQLDSNRLKWEFHLELRVNMIKHGNHQGIHCFLVFSLSALECVTNLYLSQTSKFVYWHQFKHIKLHIEMLATQQISSKNDYLILYVTYLEDQKGCYYPLNKELIKCSISSKTHYPLIVPSIRGGHLLPVVCSKSPSHIII